VKFTQLDPPRVFQTGRDRPIVISDCARITLDPDEQVTFVTESGAEYDVTRKDWGFYAAPSLNGRLVDCGFRAALVRSHVGKYYLFLVQQGSEAALHDYLLRERNGLVRWLDNTDDLAQIAPGHSSPASTTDLHCMCGADRFASVHIYFDRPDGEVRFANRSGVYRREIFRCSLCRHYVSVSEFSADAFYESAYVSSTYGDADGLWEAFNRITALPPDRSDNSGRVERVLEYAHEHFGGGTGSRSVLDVGSGLCVFLHRMKAAGWACTALDPDERAVIHARSAVGVEVLHGDLMGIEAAPRFDLVTLNKVLEHGEDPVEMLDRGRAFVRPGGLVYIEVPDGEAAAADSFQREEFFIEHFHVFSSASVALLAARAGLRANSIERVKEPSTKYTLRAFCTPC
jgi:hypothetical protein